MFSPFSKTLSFGSCASLLCSDLLSRPSYAGYCEQRSVRWAFLIYTISKALHSLPLLPGCCNLHFLWPKALSWVIQNIPVKSFASQIAFVILSLSWSAFASLIHWTQATCLSFHFTVTFFMIHQWEPRDQSSQPAPWCQPLICMFEQTDAQLYSIIVFEENLSAINTMIWIQSKHLSSHYHLPGILLGVILFAQLRLLADCFGDLTTLSKLTFSYLHDFSNSFTLGDRFICQMFISKFYQIKSKIWKPL